MRLPTTEESKQLRDLNARIRQDIGNAALGMAAHMKAMLDAFRDGIAKIRIPPRGLKAVENRQTGRPKKGEK